MAFSKSSKNMVDFFNNAPDIVIDKILEGLPIRMAAQTSVLSKQWRRAWLSLKILSFGRDFWFWGEQKDSDWQKCSRIISNILLSHDGPVHEFNLDIPFDPSKDCMSYNQWTSFLSKNGVRKFHIANLYPSYRMDITSYIFRCSEIEDLMLFFCKLNAPPTDFSGFPNLRNLELQLVHFNKPNIFPSLIENCKMLETLKLSMCGGVMDHVVLDLPRLQTLRLWGNFQALVFRNCRSLKSLSFYTSRTLTMPKKLLIVGTIDAANLQYIEFDGDLCKFLVACGIKKSSSVAFNHLNELRLSLSDFGDFRDLLFMIERCPYIKKLDISVNSWKNDSQDIVDFNYNYKLDHLREVIISGITGSSAELKLVEYLLTISPVLENLFLKCDKVGIESKLKMSSALMGFPRASPKARLLFPDK